MQSIVISSGERKANPQFLATLMKNGSKARSIDQKQSLSLSTAKSTKRDRVEIIAEILGLCLQGKNKTNVMYGANLNYAQLQIMLKHLTSTGLLEFSSRIYITTEKGLHFLELFIEMNEVMSN